MRVIVLRVSTRAHTYVTPALLSFSFTLMLLGKYLLENRPYPVFLVDSHLGGPFTCCTSLFVYILTLTTEITRSESGELQASTLNHVAAVSKT